MGADVEELIGRGMTDPGGEMPFTPRVKKVLELALHEALQLRQHGIGSGHLLLGIVREGEGVAAAILQRRGAPPDVVRPAVHQRIDDASGGAPLPDPVTELRGLAQAEPGDSPGGFSAGFAGAGIVAGGVPLPGAQRPGPSTGFDDLDNDALRAVLAARDEARRLGRPTVDLTCLLAGLAAGSGPLTAAMAAAGADPATLRLLLDAALVLGRGSAAGVPPLDTSTAAVLARARPLANGPASARDVLRQVLGGIGTAGSELLRDTGVNLAALRAAANT